MKKRCLGKQRRLSPSLTQSGLLQGSEVPAVVNLVWLKWVSLCPKQCKDHFCLCAKKNQTAQINEFIAEDYQCQMCARVLWYRAFIFPEKEVSFDLLGIFWILKVFSNHQILFFPHDKNFQPLSCRCKLEKSIKAKTAFHISATWGSKTSHCALLKMPRFTELKKKVCIVQNTISVFISNECEVNVQLICLDLVMLKI